MKLNVIQKIRLAYRRALEKPNFARVVYNRKKDGKDGVYLIDMNFIEQDENSFNTYGYAEYGNKGSIRTFYKGRIKSVSLMNNWKDFYKDKVVKPKPTHRFQKSL